MNKQVADAIASYDAGDMARLDLFNSILAVASNVSMDELFEAIPVEWREPFLAWLSKLYDNDVPLSQFIWISSNGARPLYDDDVVVRARAWLHERRERERRTAGSVDPA